MIRAEWDDLQLCKGRLSGIAEAIQGPGWAWLCYNKLTKRLEMVTTQDNDRVNQEVYAPIFALSNLDNNYPQQDYPNQRYQKFVNRVWQVVNWNKLEERLAAALYGLS